MKYTVIIEPGPNNYSAYVPDLPGCVSTGETYDEVVQNIREAIEGHLHVTANTAIRSRNRSARPLVSKLRSEFF